MMEVSMLKVITVTNDIQDTMPLINSLEKHGWDWVAIQAKWQGFGTKIIETYNFLKANPEVTEFIFADAFDVLVFGAPGEFEEKLDGYSGMIFSAEKNCWPDNSLKDEFEIFTHGFNYLNSGLYYSRADWFINLVEHNTPNFSDDDQLYFTNAYLDAPDMLLDNEQLLFNSHSFISDGEYGYDNNRIQINGNQPIFVHKNGRTVDPKLDALTNE